MTHRFTKGQFITVSNVSSSFAIWDGTKYPSEDGKSIDYALTCYYYDSIDEPSPIFSAGTYGDECGYVITKKRLKHWRACTPAETIAVLRWLAEEGYKWNENKNQLEFLAKDEKICFTPLEQNGKRIMSINSVKKVTVLKKKWSRQTKPIVPMSYDRMIDVKNACKKYNEPYKSYHSSQEEDSFFGIDTGSVGKGVGLPITNTVPNGFGFCNDLPFQ